MESKCDFAQFCPCFKILGKVTSSKSGRHILNAKRELLLALKSLIEKEVEKMDETASKSRKAQKVKVK